MAHRPGQKQESRARILASAGRGFRSRGYGGLGVDGLAKEAGVTSGAFYAHFRSKSTAFKEAVAAGLRELREGISNLRQNFGARWSRELIDFYMSDRRTCDLAESCALQSMTGDVARADDNVREAFEQELREVIAAAAEGLKSASGEDGRAEAIALLALLTGGVSLARAVKSAALSEEIAVAVKAAALRLTDLDLEVSPYDERP